MQDNTLKIKQSLLEEALWHLKAAQGDWFVPATEEVIEDIEEVLCNPAKQFSDDELQELALEMIFQLTGKVIPHDAQGRWQGNSDYQIVMTYFEKINTVKASA